jgi:hypothetical protein
MEFVCMPSIYCHPIHKSIHKPQYFIQNSVTNFLSLQNRRLGAFYQIKNFISQWFPPGKKVIFNGLFNFIGREVFILAKLFKCSYLLFIPEFIKGIRDIICLFLDAIYPCTDIQIFATELRNLNMLLVIFAR